MSSTLDMPLGDIIKANKKKQGGARKQGGAIAKGNKRQSGGNANGNNKQPKTAVRGGRQQPSQKQQNGNGNARQQQQPSARKPRQQAKQTPVAAMRAQGRVQSRATATNRTNTGRANQLAARRGQSQSQLQSAPMPMAGSQPVLVYQGPNGQQIVQPVALLQQPGQVGAQVIATGAPTRTNAPLFKVANRQQRQQGGGNNNGGNNGGNRRQSGGNQGGNQRQANNGGGRRRN